MSFPSPVDVGLPPRAHSISISGAVARMFSPPAGVLLPFSHIFSDSAPAHIKHLYAVPTVAQFKAHLEFLCRQCRPLQISEVAELPWNREDRSRPLGFLLSFDDGLREVSESVVPLLRQYGVPAIFFVNSSTIDNRYLMWRHKVSLIIDRWRQNPRRVPPRFAAYRSSQVEARLNALRYGEQSLIDELGKFYEVDFDGYLRRIRPYLTADDLVALSHMGFAIGAHSDTHPHLNELPFREQKRQISRSVTFIRTCGLPCDWFSFPFDDRGISTPVFEHLKSLDIAVSFGAAEARIDSVPFSFQRFRLDGPRSASSMQSILAELWLKSAVFRISGTGRISR